jgi:hypothetical protein
VNLALVPDQTNSVTRDDMGYVQYIPGEDALPSWVHKTTDILQLALSVQAQKRGTARGCLLSLTSLTFAERVYTCVRSPLRPRIVSISIFANVKSVKWGLNSMGPYFDIPTINGVKLSRPTTISGNKSLSLVNVSARPRCRAHSVTTSATSELCFEGEHCDPTNAIVVVTQQRRR